MVKGVLRARAHGQLMMSTAVKAEIALGKYNGN